MVTDLYLEILEEGFGFKITEADEIIRIYNLNKKAYRDFKPKNLNEFMGKENSLSALKARAIQKLKELLDRKT